MTQRAGLVLTLALSACSVQGGLAPPTDIGPAGGKISVSAKSNSALAGATLVVPAGALASTTSVSLQPGDELATGNMVALGPSLRIEPASLDLYQEATLYLPYRPSAQPSNSFVWVAWRRGNSTTEIDAVLVASSLGLAQIQISGFGEFEVIASPCGGGIDFGIEDIAYVPHDLSVPADASSQPDIAAPPDAGGGSGPVDAGTNGYPDLAPPTIVYDDGGYTVVDCADGGGGTPSPYAPAPYCVYNGTTDLAVP
jgi:hypothetical protein